MKELTLMKIIEYINVLVMFITACCIVSVQEFYKSFGYFIFVIIPLISVFTLISTIVLCYYKEMLSLSQNMQKINF